MGMEARRRRAKNGGRKKKTEEERRRPLFPKSLLLSNAEEVVHSLGV